MAENGHSSEQRKCNEEYKALLNKQAKTDLLAYYEQRSQGLIPQCEASGWGYDHPKHRQQTRTMMNTVVAQSFFHVDWNKGFTGRGVNPANGPDVLVGPKGESLQDVIGAEPPTVSETRDLWKAIDDGFDPLYRDYRDRPSLEDNEGPLGEDSDDDEDVGPFGESVNSAVEVDRDFKSDENLGPWGKRRREAQAVPYSGLQEAPQSVASQVRHALRDQDSSSIQGRQKAEEKTQDKAQEQAELDPTGGMRDVLQQILEEGPLHQPQQTVELEPTSDMRSVLSQTSEEGSPSQHGRSTTQTATSSSTSLDTAPDSSKKRDRDTFEGAVDNPVTEESPGPNPKRPRMSKIEETKATGQVSGTIHEENGSSSLTTLNGKKRQRESSSDEPAPDDAFDRDYKPDPKRRRIDEKDMYMSDDDSDIEDSLFDNREESPEQKERNRAVYHPLIRPTFGGIKRRWDWVSKMEKKVFVPDNNDTDDIVLTGVIRNVEAGDYASTFGSTSRVEPGPRSWTENEEETLRSWIQDYGILGWARIAWCLGRSIKDCQDQYQEVVMVRNKRAGRDIDAGLKGWVDLELEITPEDEAYAAQEEAKRKVAAEEKAAKEAAALAKAAAREEETKAAVEEMKTAKEARRSSTEHGQAVIQEPETMPEPKTIVKSEQWVNAAGPEPKSSCTRQARASQILTAPSNMQTTAGPRSQQGLPNPPTSPPRVYKPTANMKARRPWEL